MLPAEIHQGSAYDQAVAMITEAERVIFLGFGFDPDNIQRLKLNELCVGKTVVGSRYMMRTGEWERAKAAMLPTGMNMEGHAEWDCLAFLRETTLL